MFKKYGINEKELLEKADIKLNEILDAVTVKQLKELILDMRENNEISADIIANELFKQSVIRWRAKEPGMDDITVICVLLN